MRLNQFFAYLIGSTALALSLLVYISYIYLLGFPDGFIIELEVAEMRLSYIFIGVSVVAGGYFIYLGAISSRTEISRTLAVASILYLVFVAIIFVIDYYYRLHLPDSTGA